MLWLWIPLLLVVGFLLLSLKLIAHSIKLDIVGLHPNFKDLDMLKKLKDAEN